MQFQKIAVSSVRTSSLHSDAVDGLRHVKTLPWLSVVQVLEGSYSIRLGTGREQTVPEGGFFIAPSRVQQTIIHHTDTRSGLMRARWVFMDVRIGNGVPLEEFYEFPVVIPPDPFMNGKLDQLFGTDDCFDRHIFCLELVKHLCSLSKPRRQKMHSAITPALDLIAERYMEPLSVEQMAQSVHLSASYFFSVFKKYMGVSPVVYLNNYRLSLASELLIHTELPVNQIAQQVGVGDPVYFNKLFRKNYRLSPSAYRRFYMGQLTAGKQNFPDL